MDTLLRGPVYISDSENEIPRYTGGSSADDRNQYLRLMAEFRERAREEAIATGRLNPEIEMVTKYIQCIQGTGWWDKRRPKFKSPLYDNKLNNSRKNDLALLTDSRPTIDVTTLIKAYKQQAEIAQEVIRYEWTNRDMDLELVGAVDLAKLNGTSFWRHNAYSPGIIDVKSCGPDQVMPIQPGFHIQDSTAILYRTWQSTAYLMKKFPYSCKAIAREAPFNDGAYDTARSRFNRPNQIPQTTWERLAPQMQRSLGVETVSSEMNNVGLAASLEKQEYWIDDPSINESKNPVLIRNPYVSLKGHNYWYWVLPGEMLYPRKRLVIFVGRTLVYDGPSPFWHGKFPFSMLRLDPVKWSFWGLSKYRDLLPLNNAINEILAGVMDQVKNILNPTVIGIQGRVAPASWAAFYPGMPQAKLLLLPQASIGDIRYLEPTPIPNWVLPFLQGLGQEFDRLSGAIDITSLGKKKQVPGGDTIEQMRDAMNTTTRLESRYIEKFLQEAGDLAVSDVFQYYERRTLMRIMGAQGVTLESFNDIGPNMIPEGMPKEDHWRNFAMKVQAGSLLSNQKDRNKQLSISLATHGLIAIQTLHRALELPPQDYQDLVAEQKAGIHPSGGGSRTSRGQKNGKAA